MNDNDFQPRKNWWDRNWKWFVPTGCLSLIVLFALFIGGIVLGVTSMMKDSDAFKESIAAAQHNKIVVEKLGNPVETDGMISGSINLHNNSGDCDLQIPLKGPKGKGTLFVVATKRGKWNYEQMSVYIEKTKEEIDLLQK
ncbi:cytochrome c oxidase assembly factor Coa1 family protein [Flavobacterium defluvii]|uniref:Cytochrome oxidase complex assembly protein 1 n=1 Tax=Flavobacterium defluvii TaxID=370979 RepID=A0A1M5QY47_9FLAO|nr:cytochrome c oxidase assembly factor Coa1 family protein [Flavobacterium defluvii]SHH18690.1 Cytochrome oxidase complex assembly protein 1 [Flavobacterium defluvii]